MRLKQQVLPSAADVPAERREARPAAPREQRLDLVDRRPGPLRDAPQIDRARGIDPTPVDVITRLKAALVS